MVRAAIHSVVTVAYKSTVGIKLVIVVVLVIAVAQFDSITFDEFRMATPLPKRDKSVANTPKVP